MSTDFPDWLDDRTQQYLGDSDSDDPQGDAAKGLEECISILRYMGKPEHPFAKEVLAHVQDSDNDVTPKEAITPIRSKARKLRKESLENVGDFDGFQ